MLHAEDAGVSEGSAQRSEEALTLENKSSEPDSASTTAIVIAAEPSHVQLLSAPENILSLAKRKRADAEAFVAGYAKFGLSDQELDGLRQLVNQARNNRRRQPNRQGSGRGFTFHRTDVGNAELFAAMFGEVVRYDHRRGCWLVWREHWWTRDGDKEVERRALDAVRKRYYDAPKISGGGARNAESAWALKSENRLDALIRRAQSVKPISDSGEEWNLDPWLLGVKNGVLNLKTGKLRQGLPDDRITKHAPTAFDPSAKCPNFMRFIERVLPDPDLRRYVQQIAGQSLTGDVSAQQLYFWSGGGANGKTTLANVLLDVLGPDYAKSAPPNLLMMKSHEAHPTEIADMYGARLVISTEVERGKQLAEMLVKQLTGGDRLKARFMRQDFFEFEPTHKVILLANDRPVVNGTDYASSFHLLHRRGHKANKLH